MTEAEIVKLLELASDCYYNSDQTIMSDKEYDDLEKELKILNPNHPYFSQVGSEVRGGKIKLPHILGSLDQIGLNEIQNWIVKNNWQNELFVISAKLDGTSGLNQYGKNGKFNVAFSRGDGEFGADITRHVSKFKNIPLKIQNSSTIRCEYILTKQAFKNIEDAFPEESFKNSRNYAAGRMNASESPHIFYEQIDAIATTLIYPELDKNKQFEYLKSIGYKVPDYIVVKGSDLNDEMLIAYIQKLDSEYDYIIDGVVIDLNDNIIAKSLSRKSSSKNPMFAKKYKEFGKDKFAITTVRDVIYEASKHKLLKPVIHFDDVDIPGSGVIIKKCSGFNAQFILDNKIGIGSIIKIVRSGDVIPYCKEVISGTVPHLPDPELYGEWEWDSNLVDAVLVEENDTTRINSLISVFSDLEIDCLKEGNIVKLYNDYHQHIKDDTHLSATNIIRMTREILVQSLGENGNKVYDSIKQKLNPITMANLAGSSQCFPKGIGRRKFKKLFDHYPDLDFTKIKSYNLTSVEGFSDLSAEYVIEGTPKFLTFLNDIEGFYTIGKKEVQQMSSSNELEGRIFLFTGVRSTDLESRIRSQGGQVASSWSSKVTDLIAKDPSSTSGKAQKARDAGITPISLEEAEDLF